MCRPNAPRDTAEVLPADAERWLDALLEELPPARAAAWLRRSPASSATWFTRGRSPLNGSAGITGGTAARSKKARRLEVEHRLFVLVGQPPAPADDAQRRFAARRAHIDHIDAAISTGHPDARRFSH